MATFFKSIQKILLHLFVIGFLLGPMMYVNDMALGYYTKFPNSIIYYWLWYLMGYLLNALGFVLLYQGLVKALRAEEKLFIKFMISAIFGLLLSILICTQAINENKFREVLIVWLNVSTLGFAYVLLESKIRFLKVSNAVEK